MNNKSVLLKLSCVDGVFLFHCPGCKCSHWFSITGKTPGNPNEAREQFKWSFNGDYEKPTVRASILVRSSMKGIPTVCHSFITDGKIQYLLDCTHEFKDQLIDMEPYNFGDDLMNTVPKND